MNQKISDAKATEAFRRVMQDILQMRKAIELFHKDHKEMAMTLSSISLTGLTKRQKDTLDRTIQLIKEFDVNIINIQIEINNANITDIEQGFQTIYQHLKIKAQPPRLKRLKYLELKNKMPDKPNSSWLELY